MNKIEIRVLVIGMLFCLISYTKTIAREATLFVDMFNMILVLIIFLLLPVSIDLKTSLVLVWLVTCRTNLSILVRLCIVLKKASRGLYKTSENDQLIRNDVEKIFTSCFLLKTNFNRLPAQPSIIVSNYIYDRLENIACIMIPKNLAIVLGSMLVDRMKIGYVIKHYIIYKSGHNQYQRIRDEVREHLAQGRHVFAYVSLCTQYRNGYIGKLRSGMFRIAQELNVPITPLAIDYIDHNHGIIPYQRFEMKVGDPMQVQDIPSVMYHTRKFFCNSMKEFRRQKYS